jgi:hypothetical protein
MCCPLDKQHTHFHSITVTSHVDGSGEPQWEVSGTVDHTPQSIREKSIRAFQNLEVIEKIAEFTEQFFHFIEIPLKRFASLPLYEALHKLHHNAHEIEHFLHAACFLGDILCILTCNYLQYEDPGKTRLDYTRTAARLSHTTAHFFATAAYLSKYNICHFGCLEKVLKFGSLLTAVGYALGTSAIFWDKYHHGKENPQFYSDLGIHLGGFAFEALPIVQSLSCFNGTVAKTLEISTAIVGMIHSWFVIDRLFPSQHVVSGTARFISSEEHSHHHHHHSTPYHH